MIPLTDEEIEKIDIHCGMSEVDGTEPYYHHKYENHLAKAQLKKVVEWGNGDCDCGLDHKFDIERSVHRHFCPGCWQVLQKEVK